MLIQALYIKKNCSDLRWTIFLPNANLFNAYEELSKQKFHQLAIAQGFEFRSWQQTMTL